MNQVPSWTVWAIFGVVVVILLWNLFSTKQGNAIGFGVPKFGKKAVNAEIAAIAQTVASGSQATTGKQAV